MSFICIEKRKSIDCRHHLILVEAFQYLLTDSNAQGNLIKRIIIISFPLLLFRLLNQTIGNVNVVFILMYNYEEVIVLFEFIYRQSHFCRSVVESDCILLLLCGNIFCILYKEMHNGYIMNSLSSGNKSEYIVRNVFERGVNALTFLIYFFFVIT